ncbi:MAG: hypothetical protein U1E56_13320 [Bauldia sp.]
MRNFWLIPLLAASLAACNSSLGGAGFGGFGGGALGDPTAVTQVSADTFRIPGSAISGTSQSAVQDDVLMKAAQTTKDAGATHFIVLASTDSAARAAPAGAKPGDAARPAQDVLIRVLTVGNGQQAPIGALSADETLAFVGNRKIKR